MNSIEGALFTFLNTAPSIAAFVGGAGVSPPTIPRIYPLKLPQPLMTPALSYFIVAGESEFAIDATQVGLGYKRIQISVWSQDITQAKTIIEALRELLVGFKGTWSDVQVSVVGFNFAPDAFDHTAKLFHCSCHILIWHFESPAVEDMRGTLIEFETPMGTIDGSNTVFRLANTAQNASVVGYIKMPNTGFYSVMEGNGVDFTANGINITMTVAPMAGTQLRFSYLIA